MKKLENFSKTALSNEEMKEVKGGIDWCGVNAWAMNICLQNGDVSCLSQLGMWRAENCLVQ